MTSGLGAPQVIQLHREVDKRGNLSFFENNHQIPFTIKRTFWIYDVPGGESRGGRASRNGNEFIVALSGSFDIVLDDSQEQSVFSLNRSYYGLYIPRLHWREMRNFSTNSLALVASSVEFDETDYIRTYDEYRTVRNACETSLSV